MAIPKPYFKDVPCHGDLWMEQIIVDYDYPLLSVLTDSKQDRYLCMCFDTRGAQQWLVTPVSNRVLADLLGNKITLAGPFEDEGTEKVLVVRNYDTKGETFQLLPAYEIPIEDLPEKGEYLDAEDGEWTEYISRLTQMPPFEISVSNVPVQRRKRSSDIRSQHPVKWDIPSQRAERTGEYRQCAMP